MILCSVVIAGLLALPAGSRPGKATDDGIYDHVTITSPDLASLFVPLKQFLLTGLNLRDTIITTDNIYATQPGRDQPEKIRNFIREAYLNWETSYVLLGGDADVVPVRMTFSGRTAGGQPEYDTIPCDLYYSDLDRTWDANGNNVFGEPDDSVDMGPEVYVGRAPVSEASEVAIFVDKTIAYAMSVSPDRNEVLLAGFDWDDRTFGETTMEYYDNRYIPDRFWRRKVYDSHGGNHQDSVRMWLEHGCHYFIHFDHGGIDLLCTGNRNHSWGLRGSDLAALNNGLDRLTIFMSPACFIGAFDRWECVMEAFIKAPNGGAVATMSNSRYGWYPVAQNPQVAFSCLYIEKITARIFGQGGDSATLKDFILGKADLIPQAAGNTTYRWCMYALNLFGEPALRMYPPTGLTEESSRIVLRPATLAVSPTVFRRSVVATFELNRPQAVSLEIVDALGRTVTTLLQGRLKTGRHRIVWNGRSARGEKVGAGVYVIRMTSEGHNESRRVVRSK